MRPIACSLIVSLGLVVAAPSCGGASFEPAAEDASVGADAPGGGLGGAGSASSGGGGSGGATSGGRGSGSSGGGGGAGGSGGGSGGSVDAGGGTVDGGAACSPACGRARLCCDGKCVNPANDPFNCGACGVACDSASYCDGSCRPPPCAKEGGACAGGETCCGDSCCVHGQLCCPLSGPIAGPLPSCVTPTAAQPTCPQGCAPLCVSDRNLKRDIEPVDAQAVLERVAHLPISTWSYKTDDPSVRHLGPMAQDFSAAFGLGKTDRAYDPIDAHGVELAAIKALYERMNEEHALIERLERENEDLRQRATRGR